jgi:hypothetical protein
MVTMSQKEFQRVKVIENAAADRLRQSSRDAIKVGVRKEWMEGLWGLAARFSEIATQVQ